MNVMGSVKLVGAAKVLHRSEERLWARQHVADASYLMSTAGLSLR